MAARFWVGGAGTWDASDTAHWAASTGGAGGETVPGASDDVTFDALSGAGTCTVNTTVTVISITCGAYVGTLDFAANDNNVTLTGAVPFNGSGTGIRTINLGDGTWTLSSASAAWTMTTVTNLTFSAGASTIAFTSTSVSASKSFLGGGLTYNAVSLVAGVGPEGSRIAFTGSNTIATLTIGAGRLWILTSGTTQTITTLSFAGTRSLPVAISVTTSNSLATISIAAGTVTLDYCVYIRDMTFSGGATFLATNSFGFANNSGITISKPSFGGGVIGG